MSATLQVNRQQQNSPNRNCFECKAKSPQVQCLHCFQQVCLECAQKHVNLVAQENDGAVHFLNEKLNVLDRIATVTRQRIEAEHNEIVQEADAERDRAFTLLAQMIEVEKQQVSNKKQQLNELPLNEILKFIQKVKSDVQYLTDQNDNLFSINSTTPQIVLRRQHGKNDMKNNDTLFADSEDDEIFSSISTTSQIILRRQHEKNDILFYDSEDDKNLFGINSITPQIVWHQQHGKNAMKKDDTLFFDSEDDLYK